MGTGGRREEEGGSNWILSERPTDRIEGEGEGRGPAFYFLRRGDRRLINSWGVEGKEKGERRAGTGLS